MKHLILLIFALFVLSGLVFSQEQPSGSNSGSDNGIITGKVIESETRALIDNAIVILLDTELNTATDTKGEFSFENLKYGSYMLKVIKVGYIPVIKSSIEVFSGKPLVVNVEIENTARTEEIEVQANYFQKKSDVNLSSVNLDFEEVRRAPGSNEDISRMLQTVPGVSIAIDQRNDVVIRGGSPSENLFLIDGIEIPNINHYGSQATTGGAIGYLNLKFIRETDVLTGGFNSKYGDRMSGVVDIKLREGNRDSYINNFDFSFAGFGGVFEGPISKNTTYLFSARRSYLDLLKGAIQLSAVPKYWDFNLKLHHKFDDKNFLSLIGFSALDKINFETDETSSVNDAPYSSDNKSNTYVAGLNYTKLFRGGYMQAILSNSYSDYYTDAYYYPTNTLEYYSDSYENELNYRADFNFILNPVFNVSFGAGGKYARFHNDLFAVSDTTPQGYVIPELNVNNTISASKLFASFNLTAKLFNERIIANLGSRIDYFDYINNNAVFSPRAALSYRLSDNTSLNASVGMFYQSPQYLWVAVNPANKNLDYIRSDHYIAGIEHLFTPELKAVVEVYEKRYSGYPVSLDNPDFILIDGGMNFGPNITSEAVSAGKGYVRGLDISIQKKLSGNGIYGSVNYSYSKSGFTALTDKEKPAAFDPTHQLTAVAGYQVADDWLVGIKFKYAGGRPYTPFDVNASTSLGRGVYDMTRFNSERYPAYHRLDLRVDKKFFFSKLSMTTYLELQNVTNSQNIGVYFWNKAKNEQGTVYHWAFMPVLGVNVQF